MPLTKSAKKAARQNLRAKKRNLSTKSRYRESIKDLIKAAKNGASDEDLQKMLSKSYSEIDRAFKKNILHRNTAARKKARLARIVKAPKMIVKKNSSAKSKKKLVESAAVTD